MNIFDQSTPKPALKHPVITIGSFDGMHLGHQKLAEQIKQLAAERGVDYALVTFEPHPRQVVYPQDKTLRLITTLDEKLLIFKHIGIANIIVAPFTVEFSQISADEYIERFLVQQFNPSLIVIGYDHRFGLNRTGDIHFLKWYTEKYNYEVVEVDPKQVDEITVSSTKIRKALEQGAVEVANMMLGYQYFMSGRVVHGQKLGRNLGYPTANLELSDPLKLTPSDGIYAVYVEIENSILKGALYIGKKSSIINKDALSSIELFILDFDGDLYGQTLSVHLVTRIRTDMQFENLEALSEQIQRDVNDVRAALSHNPHESLSLIRNNRV
jgi:riboflavin kinase/FMN adenylyltransferase